MQESDIRVMRGVSIASIILAALAMLGCVACIALFAFGGYVASDSTHFEGYVEYRDDLGMTHGLDARHGLDAHETSVLVSGVFGFLGVFAGIGLLLCIVTLAAGIVGLRACCDPQKVGRVFGWSIAGAVCSILMFRVVSAVLMVVNAVYARRVRRAGEAPGQTMYGYAVSQPDFGPQPASAPQQQWQPYGQPVSSVHGSARPQEPGSTDGSTPA